MISTTEGKLKNTREILDELVKTTETSMKEKGTIPPSELIGWSFEGEALWSAFPRPNDGTSTDHAVSVLEAIQLFCFSPSATYISYFYSLDHEDENVNTICALVADGDKMNGFFGRVEFGEDGKFHSMDEDPMITKGLREFDAELFGAFSGVMQFAAAPIKDIEPLITVLKERGHEIEILAKR